MLPKRAPTVISDIVVPNEIVLEASSNAQHLQMLHNVFESSNIKAEILSTNPLKVRVPVSARGISVLLLLLEELKPEGSISVGADKYSINQEGFEKLRRMAIRSLSDLDEDKSKENADFNPFTELPPSSVRAALPNPDSQTSQSNVNYHAESVAQSHGFKSRDVVAMTVSFLALVALAIGFATWLTLVGRIGEISIVFILGASIIGSFSVVHRYASAFKDSIK